MTTTVQAGETFSYTLTPRQSGETVRAALKAAGSPASAPELAVFGVSTTADGWTLTLTAAQTAVLPPGQYVFDERITLATGAVQITDAGRLEVITPITGPGS